MYQVCIYNFHSMYNAQVNSWWVSVLLNYDTSFLLCSSLMIFYTTMLQSLIFDRFYCTCDAHDYSVENCILVMIKFTRWINEVYKNDMTM